GGAYVPIDPAYPDDRIEYIVEDTQSQLILTSTAHHSRMNSILVSSKRKNIPVDSILTEPYPSCNLNIPIDKVNMAYVICTSGTTGKPKGTALPHTGLCNLFHWYCNAFQITAKDRVLVISSFSFDLTQKNLLGVLLGGGQVHLFASSLYDVEAIIQNLFSKSITLINCTPSAFYPLLEGVASRNQIQTLRYAFLGGEPIILNRLEAIVRMKLPCRVVNTYGPTECSDVTHSYIMANDMILSNFSVPIGMPIFNTKCYVLNRDLNPLPLGAIGELCISGVGVARGYVNKPMLTSEKFIANPFILDEKQVSNTNIRIYKTGDMVRWKSGGIIEYVGRNDFQVKIRGYRIELEEIEKTILDFEGIKQVIILVKNNNQHQNNDNYLVSYYVSDTQIDEQNLFIYLQTRLPNYMVPSFLIHLDHIPLTVNGKIDRRALPEPELKKTVVYVAPRNEFEEKICIIWSEILGLSVTQIGVYDDFFKLGGNSLLIIRLLSKFKRHFQYNVGIDVFFKHSTIDQFTYFLRHTHNDVQNSIITEGEL
ncbi:MAG: amino acid adenylation domain-containing protein, partial [Alphaproteobacteria bacterium]|nr:amino acid adenylation domain-containing protein [Alphaproteobacteria bacterium]